MRLTAGVVLLVVAFPAILGGTGCRRSTGAGVSSAAPSPTLGTSAQPVPAVTRGSSESEPESAMAPPSHKLDKAQLDARVEEWRRLHPEEAEEADREDALRDGDGPEGGAAGSDLGLFGPGGPSGVYSILGLITGGSDSQIHGDDERGVITTSYQGTTVDYTYFAATGDTPGPRMSLPHAFPERTRFAIEGTMPESVLRRIIAAGGGLPPSNIPESRRAVVIDAEGVSLRGSLADVRSSIEETSGSFLNLVPQDERGTLVYQDASDHRHLLWLQDGAGSGRVQATLVTVSALPEPLEKALAILAVE